MAIVYLMRNTGSLIIWFPKKEVVQFSEVKCKSYTQVDINILVKNKYIENLGPLS